VHCQEVAVVEGVEASAGEEVGVAVLGRTENGVRRTQNMRFAIRIIFVAFDDRAGIVNQRNNTIEVIMRIVINLTVAFAMHNQHPST